MRRAVSYETGHETGHETGFSENFGKILPKKKDGAVSFETGHEMGHGTGSAKIWKILGKSYLKKRTGSAKKGRGPGRGPPDIFR